MASLRTTGGIKNGVLFGSSIGIGLITTIREIKAKNSLNAALFLFNETNKTSLGIDATSNGVGLVLHF